MIHLQVPLQIPCYDLALLAESQFELPKEEKSLLKPNSGGLTGGVCKEQGHIHRGMLIRDYYGIQLREGELQPSVRTTNGFRDCLHLTVSEPIVPSFVARV